jgi:AraC family transcriptional activator of pobA
VDGRDHRLAPGTALLLPPSTIHEFAFLDNTDGFVASAAATSLKRLFDSEPEARALLGAPAVLPMTASSTEAETLDSLMQLAMREFSANLPAREFSLAAYADLIASWFERAMRGVRASGEPAKDPRAGLVRRFVERVETRFQHHDSLDEHARELGVSVPHLSRSCRELLGRSAARVIQDRLMIEARRDLVYTAMSISQISFRLGFSDPAYFSRFFAKRAGVSPSDYRAKT